MSIRSMTGFGRASAKGELGTFLVEIRSVNNRYFDLHARLPREWAAIEAPVRDLVHSRIARGKVDLWVQWVPPPGLTVTVELGEDMICEIVRRFQGVEKRVGAEVEIPWAELFKLPGVLTIQPPELDAEALFAALKPAVVGALEQLDAMRRREGEATAKALADHLEVLRRVTDEIERRRGSVLEKQRERLRRLVEQMRAEVGQSLSDDRIEAEVLLHADRADISEEIVRLRSHLDAFEQLLGGGGDEPLGKRMEFIGQEMLREANTIGSKARDSDISAAVVELKHEIEKIREQLQNVE